MKKCRHSKRLTWRAVDAVAIVTWPALAGKWPLGVITHSVLMAPAWLALIYVFRQDRRGWVRTGENQSSAAWAKTFSCMSDWSCPFTVEDPQYCLCPKLSSECRTPSKGGKNWKHEWVLLRTGQKKKNTRRLLHTWNAHLLFMFHCWISAYVLCNLTSPSPEQMV